MRKYKRNIGAVLLLVLFAWYWSSVTLFPHAHNIDGHIYVHSHPFSGTSNNPGHSHTPQQFQLIAHLSLLVMMVATLVAFALRLLGVSFFQNAKTGRPAGRSDPDLRAACTSRLLIHIPFWNGTGLLPAPVAMYMYQ